MQASDLAQERVPARVGGLDDYSLEFDAALIEEAVLLRSEVAPAEERRRFRRDRDPLYELDDPEARERRFRDLHLGWFRSWRLSDPILQALNERATVVLWTSRCLVAPAASAKEEYADLREDRLASSREAGTRNALVLQLRPSTLADPTRLLALVRRELFYVVDLIDPEFAFDGGPPLGKGSPAAADLMRQRYRALWDTTVDGRMAAAGWIPAGGEERSRTRFGAAFPMLQAGTERAFERFFHGSRPSHPDLLAFAADPAAAAGSPSRSAGPCPLCRMPAPAFHPDPESLGPALLAALQSDFPAWRPAAGLCPRCAELYASRAQPPTRHSSDGPPPPRLGR